MGSPEVSETSCGKVAWYAMGVNTGTVLFLCLYVSLRAWCGIDFRRGNKEKIMLELCLLSPFALSVVVSGSLGIYEYMTMSSECRDEIRDHHALFWYAFAYHGGIDVGLVGALALALILPICAG